VILALSSDLIKSLDDTIDSSRLLLPDFPAAVISNFLQFLYTGEIILDSIDRDAFLSLCSLMIVDIPDSLKCSVLDEEPQEVFEEKQEVEGENIFMATSLHDDEQIDDTEEYEEFADEEEFLEGPENDATDRLIEPIASQEILSEQRLIKGKRKFEDIEEGDSSFGISTASHEINSHHSDLPRALLEIRQGMNTKEACRKYNIPKSTLYRWLKKVKE
jgi:Homeodomain-like domain